MNDFLDAAKAVIEAGMAAGGAAIEALKDVLPENVLNLFRPELTRPHPRPPQSNEFKKLVNYKQELLAFVQPFNREIDAYNKATSKELKKEALDRMMAVIKYFDVHTPPQTLAQLEKFHELKSDLFLKIKQAYAENGVHSMAKEDSSPIADILSNMSQEYADKLMEILLPNKTPLNKQLNSLYDPKNKSPEANAWRKFLSEHSIEFLGGGNSTNFKVINNRSGSKNSDQKFKKLRYNSRQ